MLWHKNYATYWKAACCLQFLFFFKFILKFLPPLMHPNCRLTSTYPSFELNQDYFSCRVPQTLLVADKSLQSIRNWVVLRANHSQVCSSSVLNPLPWFRLGRLGSLTRCRNTLPAPACISINWIGIIRRQNLFWNPEKASPEALSNFILRGSAQSI